MFLCYQTWQRLEVSFKLEEAATLFSFFFGRGLNALAPLSSVCEQIHWKKEEG